MSEIDKFCMFVNTTNGLCRSPINTKDKYCDEIPIERCYYKQLQQAKADIEKAKKYNYDAGQQLIRMSKELQQLKVENEKLKQDLQEETKLGHKATCEEADSFFEVMKLQKVLDDIEEIAKNGIKDDCGMPLDELSIILQLIKQRKVWNESKNKKISFKSY